MRRPLAGGPALDATSVVNKAFQCFRLA
jgi:hypothetical protein